MAQSNLAGNIVESVDVEAFGNILTLRQSKDFARVGFQNCGEQPRFKSHHKALDGARAMAAGKYDVLLFAKHDLFGPALEPRHQMHGRMCTMNRGTLTRLNYNTNDGKGTNWRQYGGTGFTINENMRTRMVQNGWGSDPTKLGRWSRTKIGGKDGIATVFVSAYRPCQSTRGLQTVWRQQARYFRREEDEENPDVQALFTRDLVKFLGDLRNDGHNVVLGMDANDDVRDGKLTKALWEIGMFEAVVSNHIDKSVPATCAKNTQRKPIDSIWTSPDL